MMTKFRSTTVAKVSASYKTEHFRKFGSNFERNEKAEKNHKTKIRQELLSLYALRTVTEADRTRFLHRF